MFKVIAVGAAALFLSGCFSGSTDYAVAPGGGQKAVLGETKLFSLMALGHIGVPVGEITQRDSLGYTDGFVQKMLPNPLVSSVITLSGPGGVGNRPADSLGQIITGSSFTIGQHEYQVSNIGFTEFGGVSRWTITDSLYGAVTFTHDVVTNRVYFSVDGKYYAFGGDVGYRLRECSIQFSADGSCLGVVTRFYVPNPDKAGQFALLMAR